MKIVFFTHPSFLQSQSMPRFAKMLVNGMKQRGHDVEVWSPKPHFFKIPMAKSLKRWLGYLDQYVLFPLEIRTRLNKYSPDTFFVFTDNALGPWVPLVANRPHVIHCHDFLAQRSALGEIQENPTSWSGQRYQALIRRGYSAGKHFISVSEKTKDDLQKLLLSEFYSSEVVYNGLNQVFNPVNPSQSRAQLREETGIDTNSGYLLHVGGDQWYKNRQGVIDIYDAWRQVSQVALPLLLAGVEPVKTVIDRRLHSPFKNDIHILVSPSNDIVKLAYSGATVFIFPSLAEGFGWPIAEAMASGCPVITTNEAPMTEVGGGTAFYIPRYPSKKQDVLTWATEAAKIVDSLVELPNTKREQIIKAGLENAQRFNAERALNRIEHIYQTILNKYS